MQWIPQANSGASRTSEEFDYTKQGQATFAAELPSLESDRTAACVWTVQVPGQHAYTYSTQLKTAMPIDLTVTHPGTIVITVTLTQPGESSLGCTMIFMSRPAGPASPAEPTQSPSASARYSPFSGIQPSSTSEPAASPSPSASPSESPSPTVSPTESPSPTPPPSPATGKT